MTTTETKRISDREFDEAYNDMLAQFKAMTGMDGHRRIEFFYSEDPNDTTADKPWNRRKTMQVNWSAIGTVTPEEALEFATALTIAAKLAEGFKYNGYKVYYED